MKAARPARGARPSGARTREEILAAATAQFTANGYERTSMRAVARAANVDPALVRHYFDSKVALFVEALRPRVELPQQAEQLASGDPELVGERVIRFFLATWAHPEAGPRIITLLKASLEHPQVARYVRVLIVEGVIEKVAAAVGSSDPPASATAAASQVMGLAMLRHVARWEPIASMTDDELVSRFAPVVTRHLRS
jgi:AcrR family transcriptional regulator